jgi:hypothetical protein
MATATALSTAAYVQVAADITTLKLIQCPNSGNKDGYAIELVAADSLPAVTVRGLELAAGETITSANIVDIGASGKLYAKSAVDSASGAVLTLPDA